ncbi:type IV toxin-antitoxin system AbiEi family antitoxin [Microbacterium sp. ZW T5_56]|uniref:type IV toxin-antitoxin system AbiEi family antitoxin n=1 Tax=Microbacterium sp. ZW T5_56 TaxID=3378081 RepID=UPI0038532F64
MRRFHYFPGDGLSTAELSAACLDGHLMPVGEGYIPADVPETSWMRARSLAPLLGADLAATLRTAAWVHGAIDAPPARLEVQRRVARRGKVVPSRRMAYRDVRIPLADLDLFGDVAVSSVARTIADLAREAPDDPALSALVAEYPVAVHAAVTWLDTHSHRPGIRAARALLREAA